MISVESTGGVSSWASVFNLGNCAIGAGILSFPFAINSAGLLGGILLCLVVALIEGCTLRILMCQSAKHRAESYQGLVHLVLGPSYSEFMSWIICVYLFGSCVAYLIIVGDTFGPLLQEYIIEPFSLPLALADRRVMIVLSGVTIILPLSLQRTMGALAGTSSMAVLVMVFTTVVIVGQSVSVLLRREHPFEHVALFRWDFAAFKAIPVMVFAYHCHVQAVPIFAELVEDPTLLPCVKQRPQDSAERSNLAAVFRRQLHGMYNVITVGFLECTVMYLAVGVAGYLLFPTNTHSNILNSFATDDQLIQLTRFLVGWAVVFHYPINQHVARTAIYDLATKYIKMDHISHLHIPYPILATLTLAFFVTTSVTACLVTDLGVVFHIMGGVAGALLIFVLPGALTLRHSSRKAVSLSPSRGGEARDATDRSHASHVVVDGVAEPLLAAEAHAAHGRHTPAELIVAGHAASASRIGDCAWIQKPLGVSLIALGLVIMSLTVYQTYVETAGELHKKGLLHAELDALTLVVDPGSWTSVYAA